MSSSSITRSRKARSMDALSTLQIVLRQWKIVVPVLVLTGVGAVLLVVLAPTNYRATASLILVRDGGMPTVSTVNASVLSEALEDGDVQRRVGAVGRGATYEAEAITEDLVSVSATATREGAAVEAVSKALNELDGLLKELYDADNVPNGERATVETINRPLTAQRYVSDDGVQAFRAQGSAQLLLSPSALADSDSVSPGTTYLLLGEVMRSAAFAESVRMAGHDATYELEVLDAFQDTTPLRVTAMGTDPDDVLATLDTVASAADEELPRLVSLVGMEDASPPELRLLVDPERAEVESRGLLRSLVVLIGLGAVAATALAILIERWSAISRSLLASRAAPASTGHADAEAGETLRVLDGRDRVDAPRRGYGRAGRRSHRTLSRESSESEGSGASRMP